MKYVKKNQFLVWFLVLSLMSFATIVYGNTLEEQEKKVLNEFKGVIPPENIKTVDDLYKTWQEVQEGKSKAIIMDIRTESEFDSGHIFGSNNIDSGHAYLIPKKITDSNTEIWVLCRTENRGTYFTGLLHKYGYKNANFVNKGIVGWIEKGFPLVNKYMGEFKVTKYNKELKEEYTMRENK
ncbi:MAG: rhodanese-like domain-containing protein [Candidatus Magnetoovum sp. WYHC-5]|nr:rhodanese-like domain-containing protein [Candidatus Magnetoovum sp. WYHC-5]